LGDGSPGPDPIALDLSEAENPQDHEADNSFTFDDPAYKDTLSDIPNEHSPKVLALYLVYKIFYQVKKIGTANTARASSK
jgi:hypothetical protein